MLTGIDFVSAAHAPLAVERTDVACFIGYVARRRAEPVPAAVREELRAAGWIDGPWSRGGTALESLQQLPVTLDSWDLFDRLFAWQRRRVHAERPGDCASYLGAAVRSYFAHGGRRAVVIRVANPWPYLGGDDRVARRARRLGHLLPQFAPGARPFAPGDPSTWRGIEHLCGLPGVSHVCFPDLADACALEPPPPPPAPAPVPPPEVFVECSAAEPAPPPDDRLRVLDVPRLDAPGFEAWRQAVAAIATFLRHHRPDALLVGHLPHPLPDAHSDGIHAGADWPGFLRATGILATPVADAGNEPSSSSAFVQLGWPWLRGLASTDLPRHLEPPEGVLAGLLAGNALARGTHRSIAGSALPDISAVVPEPALGPGRDTPDARLAERVCLFGPEPGGIALLSDVTTSPQAAWRQGGVSRTMSSLLRAARRIGEAQLFEASGPATWARIRRSLERLLAAWWREGALGGRTPAEAFDVRCDGSTMSQSDLDAGRVRVEISVLPAAAVERITVVLALGEGSARSATREVA